MLRIACIYLCTLLAMLVLDGAWLGLVAGPMFRAELGSLVVERFRIAPAILFYLLFVAGIVLFVIPLGHGDAGRTLAYGAAFGLVAYVTYDMTNLATLKPWTMHLAAVDIGWGIVVTALASAAGGWAGSRLAALL